VTRFYRSKIRNIPGRSGLTEELDDSLTSSRTQRKDAAEAGLAEVSKPWLRLEQGGVLAVIDIFLPETAANQSIACSPTRVPGQFCPSGYGGDLVVGLLGSSLLRSTGVG